jgi:hypothetical protein
MDHSKHYNLLIERAKTRKLDCYKEGHHIIPRCLGGQDDASNIVYLTASEHYIAHQLLAHIYPNDPKLIYAANMMCVDSNGNRTGNKRHAWLRKQFAKVHSEKMKGHIKSAETRKKLSVSNKGKKRSLEYCEYLSKRQIGRKLSEETKLKIGQANKGTIWSNEAKDRQSKRYSGEKNPMFGIKGSDHPAYGLKPWRSHISLKTNEDWKYSLVIYDYFVQDQQFNPFNKKVGHNRVAKDLDIKPTSTIRHIIEKISMSNWDPYTEPDLLVWANENNYEMPNIDLSKFRFPLAFKYAHELYDWNSSKRFRRGSKFTQLYKERPDLHNISGIPNSNIIYILETLIQRNGWNPYEDEELKNWIQKWHS